MVFNPTYNSKPLSAIAVLNKRNKANNKIAPEQVMNCLAIEKMVQQTKRMTSIYFQSMKIVSAMAGAAVISASLIFTPPPKPAIAEQSIEWDEESRLSQITCDGLVRFTLDTNQRPTSQDLPSLCSCLAKETNQKGWEVETLNKLSAGEDVGFIMKNGAIARFGKAVDSCSADKYYLSSINSNVEANNQDGSVSLGSQRLLGFLGGGPIGIVVAPWAYNLFGKNIVVWIIAGVIIGGFIWQLSIVLFMSALSLLSSIFRSGKSGD